MDGEAVSTGLQPTPATGDADSSARLTCQDQLAVLKASIQQMQEQAHSQTLEITTQKQESNAAWPQKDQAASFGHVLVQPSLNGDHASAAAAAALAAQLQGSDPQHEAEVQQLRFNIQELARQLLLSQQQVHELHGQLQAAVARAEACEQELKQLRLLKASRDAKEETNLRRCERFGIKPDVRPDGSCAPNAAGTTNIATSDKQFLSVPAEELLALAPVKAEGADASMVVTDDAELGEEELARALDDIDVEPQETAVTQHVFDTAAAAQKPFAADSSYAEVMRVAAQLQERLDAAAAGKLHSQGPAGRAVEGLGNGAEEGFPETGTEALSPAGLTREHAYCEHCKKFGHDEATCWHVHPEVARTVCKHCGRPGHTDKTCWVKSPGLAPPGVTFRPETSTLHGPVDMLQHDQLVPQRQFDRPNRNAGKGRGKENKLKGGGVSGGGGGGGPAQWCSLCGKYHMQGGCWLLDPSLAPHGIQKNIIKEHEQLKKRGTIILAGIDHRGKESYVVADQKLRQPEEQQPRQPVWERLEWRHKDKLLDRAEHMAAEQPEYLQARSEHRLADPMDDIQHQYISRHDVQQPRDRSRSRDRDALQEIRYGRLYDSASGRHYEQLRERSRSREPGYRVHGSPGSRGRSRHDDPDHRSHSRPRSASKARRSDAGTDVRRDGGVVRREYEDYAARGTGQALGPVPPRRRSPTPDRYRQADMYDAAYAAAPVSSRYNSSDQSPVLHTRAEYRDNAAGWAPAAEQARKRSREEEWHDRAHAVLQRSWDGRADSSKDVTRYETRMEYADSYAAQQPHAYADAYTGHQQQQRGYTDDAAWDRRPAGVVKRDGRY